MKLFKKKEKEEKKRNKKTIVRSEDISRDGVGDDELEDKIVSAYIPQRRAKRLGRSILRLDRLYLVSFFDSGSCDYLYFCVYAGEDG